ncbi:hypothetical protein ACI3KS_18420 [Microbacterium sp. ZW T5_45]|uniref:hypothetical protein n=1 Tax=Microbacterium sp. ZW T5_45 TaxID=3378080 RepID=UPI003851C50E
MAPVLGFVGLGLALIGTVLACIPVTFVVGVVVLIAAFVLSLIGLFKKNGAKWPSIVGIVLALVGGAIGTVVSLVIVAATLAGPTAPVTPTDAPISTPSASPMPPTAGDRPSAEEIATQFEILAKKGGIVGYEEDPDFYPCMGKFMYDSDVSDESLWLIVQGEDPLEVERESAGEVIKEATLACQE